MAIKPGEIITYKDLVDHFLDWVENRAGIINIGNLNNVPAEWKSFNQDISITRTGVHEKAPIQPVGARVQLDENTKPQIVTMDTVRREFNAFMETRGLTNNQMVNTPVTTRGIINFWNSVAAFCSTNIVLVSTAITLNGENVPTINKEVKRMYKSNTNWASVPDIGNGELIIASDITTMLGNLEEVVNSVSKMHQIIYKISAFSSTSSSCSCSSCSSSSSSMYIAYMNI